MSFLQRSSQIQPQTVQDDKFQKGWNMFEWTHLSDDRIFCGSGQWGHTFPKPIFGLVLVLVGTGLVWFITPIRIYLVLFRFFRRISEPRNYLLLMTMMTSDT